MTRRVVGAIVIAVGMIVAAVAVFGPEKLDSPAPATRRVEPEAPPRYAPTPEEPRRGPDGPSLEEPRGPDGQPLPPGTTPRQAGLPERPAPQAPLEDPEAWRQLRAEAQADWQSTALATAGTFVADLPADQRKATLATLGAFYTDLADVRARIEGGALHPRDGRAEVARLRTEVASDLVAILGPERTESLRAALAETTHGGF